MTRVTWEELAERAIVASLPSSDIEKPPGKRTKKATLLQTRIVEALKEAFARGQQDIADDLVRK